MLTLVSLAGSEPVTVDEAKLSARVDTDALDADIAALITAAREQAEHITGRCYRPQVLRAELVDWPDVSAAVPVYRPTACAVRYWTGTVIVALAGTAYVFGPGGIGGAGTALAPVAGTSWPTLGAQPVGPRVLIELTAGPASSADVPESVKLYIKAQVSAWIKTPEALSGGQLVANPLFERLLDRERLWA